MPEKNTNEKGLAKGSPKTADPGVALYGVLSLLSLTGLTCITKKR